MLRKEKKLTQAAAAREVGLSARGFQDLIRSKAPLCSALHIAGLCGDWLMGRTDNPRAQR